MISLMVDYSVDASQERLGNKLATITDEFCGKLSNPFRFFPNWIHRAFEILKIQLRFSWVKYQYMKLGAQRC